MSKVDQQQISKRLGEVFDQANTETLALEDARLVVFSDQHRGQADGADDFKPCKRAYHAALGYYHEAGYRLFVLGDVEELWECRPARVLQTYAETLKLEKKFNEDRRYVRFFGNHDELWKEPGEVKSWLGPILGDLQVLEGLKLDVTLGGQKLGTMFFTHGHQGTFDSEQYAGISKFLVRYGWRTWQWLTRWRINTPANNWELRQEHDRAMHAWASAKEKTVLIVGHTHRPVFESKTHVQSLELELGRARSRLSEDRGNTSLQEEVHRLRAELEWVRAGEAAGPAGGVQKPCYFNAGCCCFDDGDVTGLEITGPEIRLVRWPNDAGDPAVQVLARANLPNIFNRL